MHIISYTNNNKLFAYGFATLEEVLGFTELLNSLNLTFTHFFEE